MNWVTRTLLLAVGRIIKKALKLPPPIIFLGGAILAGLVMFLIEYIFELRYYPAATAAFIGFIVLLIVMQKTKINVSGLRYAIVILLVLVQATLALGTKHYAAYLYFEYSFADKVQKSGNLSLAKYDADGYLLLTTGASGIVGFIKHEIASGAAVSDSHNIMVGIKDQDYINDQFGDWLIIVVVQLLCGIFIENYNRRNRLQARTG